MSADAHTAHLDDIELENNERRSDCESPGVGRVSAYERNDDGSVSFVIFVKNKLGDIVDEIDDVLSGAHFPCQSVDTMSDDEGQPMSDDQPLLNHSQSLSSEEECEVEEQNMLCVLSEYCCQSTVTYSPVAAPEDQDSSFTSSTEGAPYSEGSPPYSEGSPPCYTQLQCQSVDTISLQELPRQREMSDLVEVDGPVTRLHNQDCLMAIKRSVLGFNVESCALASVRDMSDIGSCSNVTGPSLPVDDVSTVCSSEGISLAADGSTIESSDVSSLKSSFKMSSQSIERLPTSINRNNSGVKSPVRFLRILKSRQSVPSAPDNEKDAIQLRALDEFLRPERYQKSNQKVVPVEEKLRALDEFMMGPDSNCNDFRRQELVQNGHFREERMVPGSNNEVCFSPLNPSFSDPGESYDTLFEGATSSSSNCFNFSNPEQIRHQELSRDFIDYSVPSDYQRGGSQHSYHPNSEGNMFKYLENVVNPSSRYDKLYKLGEGGYGTVYVAHDTHYKEDIILKEMELEKIKLEDIAEEIAILNEFPHDNIMKLLDNFSTFNFYYMVFEFQSNVSLFEYLRLTGKLPEEEAVYILGQVLDAVEWLHENLIVHGDIKDENIVITATTRSIVLIDFGSARILQDALEPIMFRGTRVYSPPESVLSDVAFGQSLDVWTIGTLGYVLLNNKRPFEDDNEIVNACIPYPRCWSDGAIDFVRRCLSKEYFDRPSVTMLKYHPWIVKDSAYFM